MRSLFPWKSWNDRHPPRPGARPGAQLPADTLPTESTRDRLSTVPSSVTKGEAQVHGFTATCTSPSPPPEGHCVAPVPAGVPQPESSSLGVCGPAAPGRNTGATQGDQWARREPLPWGLGCNYSGGPQDREGDCLGPELVTVTGPHHLTGTPVRRHPDPGQGSSSCKCYQCLHQRAWCLRSLTGASSTED